MGLDMYLKRKKFIGAKYDFEQVKGVVYITIKGKELPIDFNRLSYIEEEVGYWRKANEIHNYIVNHFNDGVDDCKPIYMSMENLEELLKVCKKVKKSIKLVSGKVVQSYTFNEKGEKVFNYTEGKIVEDPTTCKELLPTCEGFFFGGTQYDEWYAMDIDNTIEILTRVIKEEKELNELGFYSDIEYRASW